MVDCCMNNTEWESAEQITQYMGGNQEEPNKDKKKQVRKEYSLLIITPVLKMYSGTEVPDWNLHLLLRPLLTNSLFLRCHI